MVFPALTWGFDPPADDAAGSRDSSHNDLFVGAQFDLIEGAADFGDKDGTVGIDELIHFACYAVPEGFLLARVLGDSRR